MGKKLHRITLGKAGFHARSGQNLLEAALASGVDMPHDCRSGRCGACLTRVRAGITMGGQTHQRGMVHACQALVFSDLALEQEPVPPIVRIKGRVAGIETLAEDIVEVAIEPARPVTMLHGQYCRFRFRGYPDRAFSPTTPIASKRAAGRIHLHVKRVRGGRVTPELGRAISPGHSVVIDGPFGHAYLRPGLGNRLVLVGSGTGFAPVWAVAAAALRENPRREIVLVAASRTLMTFYMAPALEAARRFPSVRVHASVRELKRAYGPLVPHAPTDCIPSLSADDIVYAAGAPSLVNAVGGLAAAAGAMFYADPFSVEPHPPGWLERARARLVSWPGLGVTENAAALAAPDRTSRAGRA